jgi:nitroimidazol reductase NimA-like FMN-containing flavoprotein (pyridoxamine 5'-phosphate oxidase superfamily)
MLVPKPIMGDMEQMTSAEAMELLSDGMVAHVGVISGDEPYVTPVSYVVDGDRILFRTQPGRRFRAIADSPRVCVEVSRFDEASGDWESVVVMGSAREAKDPATGELTVTLLLRKYASSLGSPLGRGGLQPMPGLPHVIEVTIESVTGMCSGRGLHVRTRPGQL